MKPKISIITISYNSEKVIAKTIESVLKQDYENIEYVLIDGGSKDKTNEIIKRYIVKLENRGIDVKYISEPDKGISDAFNKGVELATGDIIGITNSDDAILTGVLSFVAENFNEEIDVFYGNCLWIDNEKNIKYVRKSREDLSDLCINLRILHPAAYVRKSAYEKYGRFKLDYRFCMDKELLARMQRMGARFKYIDKTFVEVTAGGVSDNNLKGVIEEGYKIAVENNILPFRARIIFHLKYLRVKIIYFLKRIHFVNLMLEKQRS